MTESDVGIDTADLRRRVPDGWRVEGGGAGVTGYADEDETGRLVRPDGVPACFAIHPEGSLWGAAWKQPHELGDDLRAVSDHVTGTRERCIAWVIERVRNAEGSDHEELLE